MNLIVALAFDRVDCTQLALATYRTQKPNATMQLIKLQLIKLRILYFMMGLVGMKLRHPSDILPLVSQLHIGPFWISVKVQC